MRRGLVFALLLLLLLVITACGSQKEHEQLAADTKQSVFVIEEGTTAKTTPPTTEPPEEKPELGSRKNPFEFDVVAVFDGETKWEDRVKYEIKLTNLRRGDEAKKIILGFGSANAIPEDMEAIIFDVEFKLIQYESKADRPFYASDLDFDYFNESFMSTKKKVLVCGEKCLWFEAYEPNETAGDVPMLIPKGGQGYILFDDTLWFNLPNNSDD